jgi:hypothetical protein
MEYVERLNVVVLVAVVVGALILWRWRRAHVAKR